MPKNEGKRRKARERKVQANLDDPREDFQENRKVWDTKDSAGRAARSDTSHENVSGRSTGSMRKMQVTEKAEDNLNQKTMEKPEECGSSGMRRSPGTKRGPTSIKHTARWKKALVARGADPSSGHTLIVTKKKKAPAAWRTDQIDVLN